MIAARRYPAAVNTRAMKYTAGSLYVRKAPSQYGWDIMPRAVSAGIWRPAALELRPLDRIDDVFIALDSYNVEKAEANISVDSNLSISRDDLSRYRQTIKVAQIRCQARRAYPHFDYRQDRIRLISDKNKRTENLRPRYKLGSGRRLSQPRPRAAAEDTHHALRHRQQRRPNVGRERI